MPQPICSNVSKADPFPALTELLRRRPLKHVSTIKGDKGWDRVHIAGP